MDHHSPSQRYLSTRGGSYGLSFEEVVLKGLAPDGGLFIPEEIPSLPEDWFAQWQYLSFKDLAHAILSLYISPTEIPTADLSDIVDRSYATFRTQSVTPLVTLDEERQTYLLELFHGPTFAFKDVALQFLGNLFEYFLVRRNEQRGNSSREHLTIVGATSGDTGSAAIYGLRGKKDVSVFIMFPDGKISPTQEAQMTSVLDENVHNVAVDGTFDDCQELLKSLFGDPDLNKTHKLGAVNSINWARILAQITYYFHAYISLLRAGRFSPGQKVRFVVPTGNFGDILAGYYARRMGLPIDKLIVATNQNDILHRFWQTGRYEKRGSDDRSSDLTSLNNGHAQNGEEAHAKPDHAVQETLSPAMDILVSSNFERLLWYLAFQVNSDGDLSNRRGIAGSKVKEWLEELKSKDGFQVDAQIFSAAKEAFESERISDEDTLDTIRTTYAHKSPAAVRGTAQKTGGTSNQGGYILDPHSAIGVAASHRSAKRAGPPETHHVSLATAHPAKFSRAVELALQNEEDFSFEAILPEQFKEFENAPRRVLSAKKQEGIAGLRRIIRDRVPSSAS